MNIILFGTMGVGKTTVAKILEKQFEYFRLSLGKKIHQECKMHGSETREEMQKYARYMREVFGQDVWNDYLYNHYIEGLKNTKIVIDDGRQPDEMLYWRQKGFICIGVTAKEKLRIERIEKRSGYIPTRKQLNHTTEIMTKNCVSQCKYIIHNDDTLDELDKQVMRIMAILEVQYGCK